MKPTSLLLVLLLLQACGKNHDQPAQPSDLGKPYTLPTSPAANSSYDASNTGVYKGVTINAQDSSATFQFNIANNSKTIYCLEYMDSVLRDSMVRYMIDPATQLAHWPLVKDTSSSPIQSGTRFYTVFASYSPNNMGNALVPFAVEGDGSSPAMNVTLSSNQTLDAILKERSGQQVYCFEGSYEGSYYIANDPNATDKGRVAFVVRADTAIIIMASQSHGQFFPASGASVTGDQFTIPIIDNAYGVEYIYTCSISGNTCSGTWTRPATGDTGTFTAHRTL